MQTEHHTTRNNRILSTSSNSSSSSMSSAGKLMSISSIIATPPSSHKVYHKEAMERRASAPSRPYNHSPRNQTTLFRSPPTTPETKLLELSTPSSPSSSISSLSPKRSSYPYPHQGYFSQKYQSESQLQKHLMTDEDDEMLASQDGQHPPLTLQERRLRNKAASAKYRQKKNQQQNEMRVMISRLSEQNAVLERQLQEVRLENERLKVTTDRLRGKIVAKKMLKKWIGRQSIDSSTAKNSYSSQNQPVYYPTDSSKLDATHHQYSYVNSPSTDFMKDHNTSHGYCASSASSESDHDDSLDAIIATISDEQDENDELESLN